MKCPACDHDLTEMELGGVKVDACHGGCGGIWFDPFELQRVDEQREVPTEHLLRIQTDPQRNPNPARKRACPRCDAVKLKRSFFSAKRQVEVDHCPNCAGYWLDAGELERIREEKHSASSATTIVAGSVTTEVIRYLYQIQTDSRPQL